MRTVAMLANEAADAVNQGVCSGGRRHGDAEGRQLSARPLAWADAIGVARGACCATSAPPMAKTATASRR
jgi:3-hydroxybutyryl-CoA dehydrogenase